MLVLMDTSILASVLYNGLFEEKAVSMGIRHCKDRLSSAHVTVRIVIICQLRGSFENEVTYITI
jgi:hypothetical protein